MNKEDIDDLLTVACCHSHNEICKEAHEYINDLQQRIEKAIELMYDKATFNLNDKYGKVFLELLETLQGETTEYKLPFDEEVQNGLDSLNIRKENK